VERYGSASLGVGKGGKGVEGMCFLVRCSCLPARPERAALALLLKMMIA
jgi:hypothetical protein